MLSSYAFTRTLQTPLREGNADYRDLQGTSFCHRIQCREDHFVGEIAHNTEEHQHIQIRRGHQAPPVLAAGMSAIATRPTGHEAMTLPFITNPRENPLAASRW